MYSLQNKVALVTGGANGIGASIVRAFVKEGTKHVAFVDVTEDTGAALEEEINKKHGDGKVQFFKCDITNDAQLDNVFQRVIKEHGAIDVVVNNAGVANEIQYKKIIDVNLTALVTSSLKALDLMREDHGGKGGTIINMSSITALSKDLGDLPVYGATKSAVLQFSNRIGSGEFQSRTKVRVLTVCFGATDTNILNTCKSFDVVTDSSIKDLREKYIELAVLQSPDEAASGVVECYKVGESGSTWLINKSITLDISTKIEMAYAKMSEDVIF